MESIAPIGMTDGDRIERWNLNREISRAERLKAKNTLAALQSEEQMHQLAKDEDFIASVYDNYKSCLDARAKVQWGKCITEIMRLGKREPEKTRASAGVQVTINLIQPSAQVADNIAELVPVVKRVEKG